MIDKQKKTTIILLSVMGLVFLAFTFFYIFVKNCMQKKGYAIGAEKDSSSAYEENFSQDQDESIKQANQHFETIAKYGEVLEKDEGFEEESVLDDDKTQSNINELLGDNNPGIIIKNFNKAYLPSDDEEVDLDNSNYDWDYWEVEEYELIQCQQKIQEAQEKSLLHSRLEKIYDKGSKDARFIFKQLSDIEQEISLLFKKALRSDHDSNKANSILNDIKAELIFADEKKLESIAFKS